MKKEKELKFRTERERVIYTYYRTNREKGEAGSLTGYGVLTVLLMVLGVLCVLYCLGILLFMGYGSKFFLVWGVGGLLLIGLAAALRRRAWLKKIPGWFKGLFLALAAFGILFFGLVEAVIIRNMDAKGAADADYCLILGAQVRESGPSDVLRRRLDAAIGYLEENPGTRVLVSGGQGSNEPMTEAQGMYDYLVERGIAPERIVKEEKSTSTAENLLFSKEYLDEKEDSVVIVTSNFHVFRALNIAQKQGYENVTALAASTYPYMLPNNLLREFFGVVKDVLPGGR